ncbi:class I SAM-dependent DNA methyltransferase [Blastochloris viridis]|uniref:Biotin biosynthesis protein BioC n=1 Tax=Blastochloris viridis TaxID=1079 RepID=A0A0S4Q4W5_BLAVI|nr:methyltransferase domain-containing protein [Blastochloris viridis]CUU43504.1 biotin biosynthesis protein BioC [Blastochloris viridis]
MFRSSGDPLADRRYNLALDYRRDGDLAAAADLLAQTVEIAPGWAAAWFALGEANQILGVREAAANAFRHARDADPGDELGAGLWLARLGDREVADAMASGYVEQLFDQYAPEFDHALVDRLGYNGPQLLAAALTSLRGGDFRVRRCLDLGCGTGLIGAALRPHCATLIGIDLSAGMLAQAKRRGCYDALVRADLLAALTLEPAAAADLIVAADTMVYVGELGPVLAQVARVLEPGGLFAATLERCEAGVELHLSLRYRHGADYLRERADAAGLEIAYLAEASARQDGGVPVPGLVAVLAKPETASPETATS